MSTPDFWVGPFAEPDRYRLVSLLGGGGEGEVWEAVLPLSAEGRSTVAVKIVPARERDEQEFDQGGRLLRMLHHPGLVRVTESFTGPGMHRGGEADPTGRANYVVMDHVVGITLREWCDENPDASAAARLKMLRTAASALDVMHSGASTHVPVAHGDVKPANVIVRPDGGSVLVDLGLARLADGGGMAGRSAPYAAPELRGGYPVPSPEADRFAFAVTVAQVLIGSPVPTTPDGWVDPHALGELLYRSPVTARRPLLVRHVLDALAAPPEARPHPLRVWLDSAAESLSQVTSAPGVPRAAAAAAPYPAAQHEQPHPMGIGFGATPTAPFATAAHQATVRPGPTHDHPRTGPGVAGTTHTPSRRRRRLPFIVAALLIVVIGGAAGIAYLTGASNGNNAPSQAPAQAPTHTEAAGTSEAAPITPIASTAPTGTSGRATTSQYLSDLTTVERDGENGGVYTNAATISGQKYGHAITLTSFCSNHDGGDFWADYNLGRDWTRFTATVGLDDSSLASSKATYTLLADTTPIATGSLSIGQAVPIDVSVTGALRLRLKINDPHATTPSCGYNTYAKVGWGDPKLVP